MPYYDYECKKCGHKFDRLGKYDDPPPPCPNPVEVTEEKEDTEQVTCGGETKRLISRSSFILKGGGWADSGYS